MSTMNKVEKKRNEKEIASALQRFRETLVDVESLSELRAALTEVILKGIGATGIVFYPLYRGAKPDADVVLHSAHADANKIAPAAVDAFPRMDRELNVIASFLKDEVRVRDVVRYYGKEKLEASTVYREILVPFHAEQVLSAFLGTDKPSALAYLCVTRAASEPPFTEEDLALLETIRCSAEKTLHRMVEEEGESSTSSQILGILAAGMPHPSALLDAEGVLLWANLAAEKKLGDKVLHVNGRYVMFASSSVVDRWRSAVRDAHEIPDTPYRSDRYIIVNRIDRPGKSPLYMVVDTEALVDSDDEWQALSAREKEIAELAAQGYAPLNIGAVLSISTGTVRNHLKSIYRKLNVSSRVELALKRSL